MSDSEADGLNVDWRRSSSFRKLVQESFEKHSAQPLISPKSYLAQKHTELACDLREKVLIYLDTNHWVNLCQVALLSPKLHPAYSEILRMLDLLSQQGRICCPVSSTLLEELMKQSDSGTRAVTARLMDNLSKCICIQNWRDLVTMEFKRHASRILYGGAGSEVEFLPWTKAGFWAGERLLEFCNLSERDKPVWQKVYVDVRWAMTFEDYQTLPNWLSADEFCREWADFVKMQKCIGSAPKPTLQKSTKAARTELLDSVKDALLPVLRELCVGLPGGPYDHISSVFGSIYDGSDPFAVPSIEVVVKLGEAVTSEMAREVQPNDMFDIFHAAHALPYFDALFCDRFMATKILQKPQELGRVYGTVVLSRPEKIIEYLQSLA